MPFDREAARHPYDLYDYMERFCRRSDLVSNQPKGISHMSKEDQLSYCLREADGLDLGSSRARLSRTLQAAPSPVTLQSGKAA